MNHHPQSPTAEAAARLVLELAAQADMAAGHFQHPSLFTPADAPTPLVVLRTAKELVADMHELVRRHILLVRGSGEDWDDVAAALGLRDGDRPDACAAYLTALGVRSDDPWWTPARGVLWRCSSCEEVVRDFGPEAGGPDDRESGHAATCARHTGEQLAWDALWA